MTFDTERELIHSSDPVINDVCADCNNNRITYIDSYAKVFIEKYFTNKYEKDDVLEIDYNYVLLQKMALKYAFNDLRSRKKDTSFFDDDIKRFLLNESEKTSLKNVTLLAGLAINTSPVPDYVYGNMKVRWGDSLIFLDNSIVENLDYQTRKMKLRSKMEKEEFKKCALTYVFRFNSLQLLMICWEKDIEDEVLIQNKTVLEYQYPYQILSDVGKSDLTRCTSEATYHYEKLIDVTWGQSIMDEISYMRGTFSDQYQSFLSFIEKQWKDEEKNIAKQHPR